eukprot:COSAG01_NODE_3865_length_5614_cov_5.575159_3_plen_196_part_00
MACGQELSHDLLEEVLEDIRDSGEQVLFIMDDVVNDMKKEFYLEKLLCKVLMNRRHQCGAGGSLSVCDISANGSNRFIDLGATGTLLCDNITCSSDLSVDGTHFADLGDLVANSGASVGYQMGGDNYEFFVPGGQFQSISVSVKKATTAQGKECFSTRRGLSCLGACGYAGKWFGDSWVMVHVPNRFAKGSRDRA